MQNSFLKETGADCQRASEMPYAREWISRWRRPSITGGTDHKQIYRNSEANISTRGNRCGEITFIRIGLFTGGRAFDWRNLERIRLMFSGWSP